LPRVHPLSPLLCFASTSLSPSHLYALSLHDALPISALAYETVQNFDRSLPLLAPMSEVAGRMATQIGAHYLESHNGGKGVGADLDRKSTRLNSSHLGISYAVFCLKKKSKDIQ